MKNKILEDMGKFWGNLVDQVAFVNYIPWENVYDSERVRYPVNLAQIYGEECLCGGMEIQILVMSIISQN